MTGRAEDPGAGRGGSAGGAASAPGDAVTAAPVDERFSAYQLREVVDRVRRVPEDRKQFLVSSADAARLHQIDPPLLDRLLEVGLPHRGVGAERRFDALDLENVGLGLRLPCPRWRAMRWWSRALLRDEADLSGVRGVTAAARCPAPGHGGDCDFALHADIVAAAEPGTVRTGDAGRFAFDVRLTHREARLDDRYAPLIEQITPLHFHVIPRTLHDDVGFARETKLASCGLATRLTVRLGRELGLAVRPAYGYFMTEPYLTWHTWPEFEVDGEWLPGDPFLLTAFGRWGLAGADRWPANRAIGGLMWRVGCVDPDAPSAPFRPVTHRGVPVSATMMAKARVR